MARPLEGRVALVTGAAHGIGAAVVRALAAAGARVAVHYRSSRRQATKLALEVGGVAVPGALPKAAEKLVDRVVNRLGRLDILINNASHVEAAGWTGGIEAVDDGMWKRAIDADILGTFACSRAAARVMKRGGKIVNFGSLPALAGDREGLVYSTVKAAIIGMSRSLAVMLAPRVQVNCLALGSIETRWVDWLPARMRRSYEAAIPMKRFGRPEEVAQLVLFLVTSDWATGQTFVLDGGESPR